MQIELNLAEWEAAMKGLVLILDEEVEEWHTEEEAERVGRAKAIAEPLHERMSGLGIGEAFDVSQPELDTLVEGVEFYDAYCVDVAEDNESDKWEQEAAERRSSECWQLLDRLWPLQKAAREAVGLPA